MFLLDTNVVTELMRDDPNEDVATWINRQQPDLIWTTSITVMEIELGIARLAQGRKQAKLYEQWTLALHHDLPDRVASFDEAAAHEAARLQAAREKRGMIVEFRDTEIAGIALARNATVVTRNTRHFHDLGTRVCDPWAADF